MDFLPWPVTSDDSAAVTVSIKLIPSGKPTAIPQTLASMKTVVTPRGRVASLCNANKRKTIAANSSAGEYQSCQHNLANCICR